MDQPERVGLNADKWFASAKLFLDERSVKMWYFVSAQEGK